MQAYRLIHHPSNPPVAISGVEVKMGLDDPNWLLLRWRIDGTSGLVTPPIKGKRRADDLWRTTCFELFAMPDGEDSYVELNLSPSEEWNLYAFDTYREGMRELDAAREPVGTMRKGSSFSIFDAAIPWEVLPDRPSALGVCAVLEELEGIKSYWALTHESDEAPDFHHPACFAAKLDAARAP